MGGKKLFNKQNILIVLCVFVLAALITCAVLKEVIFSDNSISANIKIVFDDSVEEKEREFIEKYFSTRSDNLGEIKVSAENLKYTNNLEENAFVYNVKVPVVDFYSGILNISDAEADLCDDNPASSASGKNNDTKCKFIDLKDLTFSDRLVSINEKFYLDDFNSGAIFRVLKIESGNTENDKLQAENLSKEIAGSSDYTVASPQTTLSFAQTGVTALTRAMTTALNTTAKGDGAFFAKNIADFLKEKDITHISNEVSFIENCPGGSSTMTLCSDWRTLDTIKAIGADIVELSGNHNNNYGYDANKKTIEKYHELGIKTFGGGVSEEAAKIPIRIAGSMSDTESVTENGNFEFIENSKGASITLLSYNKSTSSKANGELADGDKPGANGYDENRAKSDIEAAKKRGDFVIVDVQFFECYCYPNYDGDYPTCDYPISNQQEFFRSLIDMGADMVVGVQAHQPQTFEKYKNGSIYYGLGNLFFDQIYWYDTMKGLALTHYFIDGKYVQTRISPTIYGKTYQTKLMDESTAEKYVNRLINASPNGK